MKNLLFLMLMVPAVLINGNPGEYDNACYEQKYYCFINPYSFDEFICINYRLDAKNRIQVDYRIIGLTGLDEYRSPKYSIWDDSWGTVVFMEPCTETPIFIRFAHDHNDKTALKINWEQRIEVDSYDG